MDASLSVHISWIVVPFLFWAIAAILNKDKRDDFWENLVKFLKTPLVMGDNPLISVRNQKAISEGIKETFDRGVRPLREQFEGLVKWLWKHVWEPSVSESLTAFLYAVGFILFFLADTIAIINALEGTPYAVALSPAAGDLFSHFELAVVFGSLFTIVVAFTPPKTIEKKKDVNDRKEIRERLRGCLSLYLVFGGLFVIVALGLKRLEYGSNFTPAVNQAFDFVNNFAYTFIVPFNVTGCAIIIFNEAAKGFLKVFLLAILLILILPILVLVTLGWVIQIVALMIQVLGVELTLKILLAVLFTAIYLLFTPLQALANIGMRVLTRPQKPKPSQVGDEVKNQAALTGIEQATENDISIATDH